MKSEIFVKKWVDYSSKYGLGYLLSNGSTGVYFNDSTKMVAHPKNMYYFQIKDILSIWKKNIMKNKMKLSNIILKIFPKIFKKKSLCLITLKITWKEKKTLQLLYLLILS